MIAALAFTTILSLPALSLPVRVDGEGYLRFIRDGRIVYANSATLTVQNGLLGAKDLPLTPSVRVPANAVRLEVDLGGNIVAIAGTSRAVCGRIVLASFEKAPISDRGFLISSDRASIGNPGEGAFGVIRSTNSAATIAPAIPGGAATVAVQGVSEVSGDTVTLADVATITADAQTKRALEAVVLFQTPSIGIDMPVTTGRIQALLKRAGLAAEVTVPAGAIVRRMGQAIKGEDFIVVATKAAQERFGAQLPMTCTDAHQGEIKAPLGQVELKAEGVSTSGTTASVVVKVYVEGRPVISRTVGLRVDGSAQVKAGAIVKIVMRSAGVSVQVPGKTRTGGMIGQTVTVVTDTGSVLTGVVIGADLIEVKL